MKYNKTIEQKTCFEVLNLRDYEATSLIRERGLVDRVVWQDGKNVPPTDPCYISSRINLKIKRGKIISAQIG